MVPASGGWKLAGITSWGFGCASHDFYGAYTRVANYSSWVYSFPPIAPFERDYPSILPTDADPFVGAPLTCSPGTWLGENLEYSFQWYRVGQSDDTPIPGATNATYTLSLQDVDTSVYCKVTAANASGTVSDTSGTSGTVYVATPTPAPTVAPLDVTAPNLHVRSTNCKNKVCQVVLEASDDLSAVDGIEGRLSFRADGCSASNGSTACQSANQSRTLAAAPKSGNRWKFRFSVKRSGRGVLAVRARDTAGNLQLTPTKIKLVVH